MEAQEGETTVPSETPSCSISLSTTKGGCTFKVYFIRGEDPYVIGSED